MVTMNAKPNCYECKHRGEVPGDAHSCCNHPIANPNKEDPISLLISLLASVGRTNPVIGNAAVDLGISGNAHGIRKGWFNWPWNFDPVWLETCKGFEKNEKNTGQL